MKVVILAGGKGTRISEESLIKPKPLIEIGGMPIIWHIMKHYSYFGFNDFIICLGYKGSMIKDFFRNYFINSSDITFDKTTNNVFTFNKNAENWKVSLVDTGLETSTGGRLKKIGKLIDTDRFFFTYGDGVSNINLKKLLKFHINHKKLATITAVQPPGRFGALTINKKNSVKGFQEKPLGDNSWINGGFFCLEKKAIKYIKNDNIPWEKTPLEKLAKDNQINAFCHNEFWHPMDTLRDKILLENLWSTKKAPWKLWK